MQDQPASIPALDSAAAAARIAPARPWCRFWPSRAAPASSSSGILTKGYGRDCRPETTRATWSTRCCIFDADAGQPAIACCAPPRTASAPVNEAGLLRRWTGHPALREVKNPSAIFLSRNPQPVPREAWVMVARDGGAPRCSSRLQALTDRNALFSAPAARSPGRRLRNRLAMMLRLMRPPTRAFRLAEPRLCT